MALLGLGYAGFGSDNLEDWRQFGTGLVGRLVMFDARDMRFETIVYGWDAGNPLSGEKPTIRDLSGHG